MQGRYSTNPALGPIRNPPLVLELLRHAATSSDATNRIPAHRLEEIDARQFQWVLQAGLGPLLHRATDSIPQVPTARRSSLRSADLTAQVIHGNLVDTANEVIDLCHDIGVRVTLLKGISISDQYYPAPHLRPMGDVDVLVAKHAQKSVESVMMGRGYQPLRDYQLDEDSIHGVPLLDPQRSVWVEVHTALFPSRDKFGQSRSLSPSQLHSGSVASTFHGRQVYRLKPELQLLYTASFWIRDLSLRGFHASFLPPLFDAAYLLTRSNQTLNWDGLLTSLDDDMVTASLYIMLAYLARHCDFPSTILDCLASRQNTVRGLELKLIQFMLDTHLIRGRPFTQLFESWHVWDSLLSPGSHAAKLLLLPWNILFPPRLENRYSVRYQLERMGRFGRTKG